jgi:hypothetical protein
MIEGWNPSSNWCVIGRDMHAPTDEEKKASVAARARLEALRWQANAKAFARSPARKKSPPGVAPTRAVLEIEAFLARN